jgi:hypothetical protein
MPTSRLIIVVAAATTYRQDLEVLSIGKVVDHPIAVPATKD